LWQLAEPVAGLADSVRHTPEKGKRPNIIDP
jgi:hypothetical protein